MDIIAKSPGTRVRIFLYQAAGSCMCQQDQGKEKLFFQEYNQ